jgi:hypothetical protein
MRMRKLAGWACAWLWVMIGLCAASQSGEAAKKKAAAPAKSKTAPKPAPKTTAAKSPAKTGTPSAAKSGAASKSGAKSASKKSTSKRAPKTTWRNRQLAPAPERYKEIQDALAAKGFLNPDDANGQWGASSVAALKSFQSAQNIDGNGKINSLSLIALGLGPKRESPVAPKPPEPAAARPPEAAPAQP